MLLITENKYFKIYIISKGGKKVNELRKNYVINSVETEIIGQTICIRVAFMSSLSHKIRERIKELIMRITLIGAKKNGIDWPNVSPDLEDKEVAQRYHFSLPIEKQDSVMALIRELGLGGEFVLRSREETVLEVYEDAFTTTGLGTASLKNADQKLKIGDKIIAFYNTSDPITMNSDMMMVIVNDKVIINQL